MPQFQGHLDSRVQKDLLICRGSFITVVINSVESRREGVIFVIKQNKVPVLYRFSVPATSVYKFA